MTSTLPNFAACVATPGTPTALGSTTPAGTMSLPGTAMAGPDGAPVEFAALLPAAPAVEAAPVAVQPAAPSATAVVPTVMVPTRTVVVSAKGSSPVAGAAKDVRVREVSREEIECASAFVASLMQALLPPPDAPVATETTLAPAEGIAPASTGSAPVVPPAAGQTSVPVADELSTTRTLPNGRAFPAQQLPEQAKPSLGEGRPVSLPPPASARPAPTTDQAVTELPALPAASADGSPTPDLSVPLPSGSDSAVPAAENPLPEIPLIATPADQPRPSAPVFTIADDGAIELKLSLPVESPADAQPVALPATPLEVSAELEVPGQAVIRVEATVPHAPRFSSPERPEIFAGQKPAVQVEEKIAAGSSERNFVFTGEEKVKVSSPKAGITVAKTDATMPAAPTEEIRPTRNPEGFSVLPVRSDLQGVQSPAERIAFAPAEPVGQNLAERAVATVTSLAEAQFSASMHKAGSVQLKLKFGGEDLSVRVELRDGAVHTDFRTDSPALREALAREWQAVAAASPGHLQRFLDPVFSPGSSPAPDAGAQQQQSFHRQPAQQQAQEQAAQRQDVWHSQSPFTRRSALSASFVPEPAAPRVPALLPTSLRLSALA